MNGFLQQSRNWPLTVLLCLKVAQHIWSQFQVIIKTWSSKSKRAFLTKIFDIAYFFHPYQLSMQIFAKKVEARECKKKHGNVYFSVTPSKLEHLIIYNICCSLTKVGTKEAKDPWRKWQNNCHFRSKWQNFWTKILFL